MKRQKRTFWHYLIALGILWGAWDLTAYLLQQPAFPPVPHAVRYFVSNLTGDLGLHFVVSLRRVLLSMFFAAALGLPIGLYLGRSGGPIGTILVYLTHPIPKVVFLPIALVVLGISDASKVFLIALIVFFQIIVMVRDAAAAVSPGHIRSLLALRATEWQIYRHVVIPSCLPPVFTALRLTAGTAVAVLFFAETYATRHGLGAHVWDAWSARAFDAMFAGVMAMGLMGFGLYLALEWAERKVCPWVERR